MTTQIPAQSALIDWLLSAPQPYIRYQALRLFSNQPESSPLLHATRQQMLNDPSIVALIQQAQNWSRQPLQRHNDSSHPIHLLSTLADFGLTCSDPGIYPIIDQMLHHQSEEGAFQSLMNISPSYGGRGENQWAWIACDVPTVLYILAKMGLSEDTRVQKAMQHLESLVESVGYRCKACSALGKFRGPGKKEDPCPLANLLALKAFSVSEEWQQNNAVRLAANMILSHWEMQQERKYYLFGIGTDFRKLKYPLIWYDLLHTVDVLSRFSFLHSDPRFQQMWSTLSSQADSEGKFTPSSIYMPWKEWEFSNKKQPSRWLTLLVMQIEKRMQTTPA